MNLPYASIRNFRQVAIISMTTCLLGALALISGCEKGAFEDAGEEIDEAVEEVQDEIDDATSH